MFPFDGVIMRSLEAFLKAPLALMGWWCLIGVMGLKRDDNDHNFMSLEALILLANERLILELSQKSCT